MADKHYTEQDPLLPKGKGAPEIQGSRPQSINDEYVIEEQDSDEDNQLRHNTFNNLMTIIFGACFFGSIFVILFTDGPLGDLFGDQRPLPKTLEERVNRILEDTPLIGIHS